MKTLTAKRLIQVLRSVPADTKVYISSDSGGNEFGTIDLHYSFQWSKKDNALAIYMFEDHLMDSDIMPIQNEQIIKELQAEGKLNKVNECAD